MQSEILTWIWSLIPNHIVDWNPLQPSVGLSNDDKKYFKPFRIIRVLLSCLHFAMVTWRSNFMTHGWHFLHLFVCSISRTISDIHVREEVWVYILLAPTLLILTIWGKMLEFHIQSVWGTSGWGCYREGGITKQQIKVVSLPWEPDCLWGREQIWGGGSEKTHYYIALFVFKIVCGMEMSLMQILTWRGLTVALV